MYAYFPAFVSYFSSIPTLTLLPNSTVDYQVYSMWNYFLPQVQAYQPNRKLWALFITLAHSLMRLMWVLGCNYLP